ncbi:MAG: carbohydrate binding family 9 domain-containing protein, partial [Salinivenus sp.]
MVRTTRVLPSRRSDARPAEGRGRRGWGGAQRPSRGVRPLLGGLLFLLLIVGGAQAQSAGRSAGAEAPFPRRVSDPSVQVDGRLQEAVWSEATAHTDWYQQRPNEGAAPSQATAMWLVHDEEALYLAARLEERNPNHIAARTLQRDSYDLESGNQDAVALILDTFNDQRSALGFVVTPAGVRTDLEIASDGRSTNPNWDGFWTAATQRDGQGWTVEMRIPFSTLRFSTGEQGLAEMGLILWRYRARNAEYDIYPAIPNEWS